MENVFPSTALGKEPQFVFPKQLQFGFKGRVEGSKTSTEHLSSNSVHFKSESQSFWFQTPGYFLQCSCKLKTLVRFMGICCWENVCLFQFKSNQTSFKNLAILTASLPDCTSGDVMRFLSLSAVKGSAQTFSTQVWLNWSISVQNIRGRVFCTSVSGVSSS